MRIDFVTSTRGQTDKGMVRKANQDSFLVNNEQGTFVVADGMGGHAGGEVASQMSISVISSHLQERLLGQKPWSKDASDIFKVLSSTINQASTKIYEKALEEPGLKGMGTTVTLLQVMGDQGYFAHVGDSRLYLLRCGFLYQLTHDHSLVSEQVEAGLLTEEEAEIHQLRNVITRSVGYQETEYVDTDNITLKDHDYLVLCSDGLHGKMTDQEICHMVLKHDVDAVDPLIDLANERGGEDNITVVIVKVRRKI